MLIFNPVYENHWLKKFIEEEKNLTAIHCTYRDNAFLSEEDKETLENFKFTDRYFYDVFCNGIWGKIGEIVFDQNKLQIKDLSYLENENFKYGLDFGFTMPSACIKARLKEDKIYIYDEIYKKKLSNEVLGELLKEFCRYAYIRADSSEPKTILSLQMQGLRVIGAKKGSGSVISGIRWLRGKEFFVDPRCKNFVNEYRNLSWRKDKNGDILQEIEGACHLIDALRYCFEPEINYNLKSQYQALPNNFRSMMGI